MADETRKVVGNQMNIHQAVYSRMLDSDLLTSADGDNCEILDSATAEGHPTLTLQEQDT